MLIAVNFRSIFSIIPWFPYQSNSKPSNCSSLELKQFFWSWLNKEWKQKFIALSCLSTLLFWKDGAVFCIKKKRWHRKTFVQEDLNICFNTKHRSPWFCKITASMHFRRRIWFREYSISEVDRSSAGIWLAGHVHPDM